MTTPLEKMKNILVNMPPAHRQRLVDAYKKFGTLKSLCAARGEIEILPQLKGIKVLKRTEEVKELKAVVDFLKPSKFIWEEKGRKKAK